MEAMNMGPRYPRNTSATSRANHGVSLPVNNNRRKRVTANVTVSSATTTMTAKTSYYSITPGAYRVITGQELNNLLHTSKLMSFLLVDCRPPNDFQGNRIHYSLNAYIDDEEEESPTSSGRFTSQADVVKFLQEYCPSLLGFLNAPGFYTDVVIFDDVSTAEHLSRSVLSLLCAITKWNQGTKTSVRLLDGGVESFGKKYPYRLTTECTFPVAWSFPAAIEKLEQCSCAHCSERGRHQDVSSEDANSLYSHLKNIDAAVNKTWFLVVCTRQLNSLEAIKATLMQEEIVEMAKEQELLTPDPVKCPICFEIYNGDIIQCVNGHCLCGGCSVNLNACPECRVPYGSVGPIRNRALERMLTTVFKVDCPFSLNGCYEKITYDQIAAHMKICTKRSKSAEVLLVEDYAEIIEAEAGRMNQRLTDLSKDIMMTELGWNTARDNSIPGVTQQLLERVYYNNGLLNKARLALNQETFIKNVPVTEKSTMFT